MMSMALLRPALAQGLVRVPQWQAGSSIADSLCSPAGQLCVPMAGRRSSRRFGQSRRRNLGVAMATWTEQPTRKELMHEAMERLTEQDLEATVQKYDLEEELFAEVDFAQIDAFTDKPFGGNPAAVCYLPMWRDDAWLQNVAKEFNLSETAFLVRRRSFKKGGKKGAGPLEAGEDGSLKAVKKITPQIDGNEFDLRWFTPTMEVDLCGHATLAAAHLLFSAGLVEDDQILFHTRSGVLPAWQIRDPSADPAAATGGPNAPPPEKGPAGKAASVKRTRPPARTTIELDFPELLAEELPRSDWLGIEEMLGGLEVLWAGTTSTSLPYVLVEVGSENAVRDFVPDISKLAAFPGGCVVLTARADEDSNFDFVSRFFAPCCGLPEDPVTGSAHCMLGPYWSTKLSNSTLQAFQASERGGYVTVHWSKEDKRVKLRGTAVTVMAGMLLNTVNTPKQ